MFQTEQCNENNSQIDSRKPTIDQSYKASDIYMQNSKILKAVINF